MLEYYRYDYSSRNYPSLYYMITLFIRLSFLTAFLKALSLYNLAFISNTFTHFSFFQDYHLYVYPVVQRKIFITYTSISLNNLSKVDTYHASMIYQWAI